MDWFKFSYLVASWQENILRQNSSLSLSLYRSNILTNHDGLGHRCCVCHRHRCLKGFKKNTLSSFIFGHPSIHPSIPSSLTTPCMWWLINLNVLVFSFHPSYTHPQTAPYPPPQPCALWLISLTVFIQLPIPPLTPLHSLKRIISVISVSTSLLCILLSPLSFHLLFASKHFCPQTKPTVQSEITFYCLILLKNKSFLTHPSPNHNPSSYLVSYWKHSNRTLADTNQLMVLHCEVGAGDSSHYS